MPDPRRALGAESERHAERYLRERGLQIVGRNVRTRFGELDIVARDGDELVFVEVKSRRAGSPGSPLDSMTHVKFQRLMRLAQEYLADRGGPEPPWRIDVVAVILGADGRVTNLTHILHAVE